MNNKAASSVSETNKAARTADELIARHIEARGGLESIMAIDTLCQRGTVVAPDYTVDIYGERKRPDLLRIEFTIDEKAGVEGWNGSAAWELNPWKGMEQAEYVTGLPAIALQRGAEFDGPLVNYQQKGHTARYTGIETVEGQEAHCLEVVLRDGNVIYHYLDTKTMLVAQTRAIRPVHGTEPSETSTFYYDYRAVAGVLYSFHSREHARGGEHDEVFRWEMMEANVPLDRSRFDLPHLAPNKQMP